MSFYDIYDKSLNEFLAVQTLVEIVEPILLIFGSIALAIALCVLLWRAFSWLHHPDWAAWAAIIAGALALYATSPHHVFYRLVVAFTLIGAVALWIEGRAWRRRRARPIDAPAPRPARDGVSAASGRPGRYPIIIDCIGEARSPRQEEVRAVAARIWREGWQDRMVSHGPVGSFAMRRLVFKMANAALRGDTDRRMARRSPDNDL